MKFRQWVRRQVLKLPPWAILRLRELIIFAIIGIIWAAWAA